MPFVSDRCYDVNQERQYFNMTFIVKKTKNRNVITSDQCGSQVKCSVGRVNPGSFRVVAVVAAAAAVLLYYYLPWGVVADTSAASEPMGFQVLPVSGEA